MKMKPILIVSVTAIMITFIAKIMEIPLIKRLLTVYEAQSPEFKSFFQIDQMLADSMINTMPPILWFWAFTTWRMREPGKRPALSDNDFFVCIAKTTILSPLSNLLFAISGALLGAAYLIYQNTSLKGVTLLTVVYSMLLCGMAYGLRYTTYFKPVRQNKLGYKIYENKKIIAIVWLILGLGCYYYGMFAPIIDMITTLYSMI
ncbi:MAG: hypothetical protein AAGJ37_00465 [Pseudomonadota bacterium]